MKPYRITCVQSDIRHVMNLAAKKETIDENLNRCLELIDGTVPATNSKIVVFPEFFLTGYSPYRTLEDWLEVSIKIPGEETDKLSEKARQYGIYIAGNNYEIDDEWPERFFHTSFIIGPEGKVILKHRTINVTSSALSIATSPADIYTEYIKKYGQKGMFPVVDTPLGKLACFDGDIFVPETTRCFMLSGAEVFLLPLTAGSAYMAREVAMVRACDNMAYVAVAGAGEMLNLPMPRDAASGQSLIIDFEGKVIEESKTLGESIVSGLVDIDRLREARSRPVYNLLVMLRSSLYAPIYKSMDLWPLDGWVDKPIKDRGEALAVLDKVLDKLYKKGIIVKPS